ncbi:DUF1552 domain-containing protein [Stratiformator vulcanicus]|uniref:Secreted protein containing DUF1552 n=1 Tax=Stratiformator vulcanicus TaxID=2527980 RepID=A0A517R2Y1_9PLAN|nr:DUF1552 domain-containing protein [Stratiformator vulcanicus]QDT38239.1 hypothetical protein Pan189_26290 [Stratiformator vulcanicus]
MSNKIDRPARRTTRIAALPRRAFLRGTGVALGLPMLDAMTPAFSRSAHAANSESEQPPQRMLAVCNNLGLLPPNFFPKSEGLNYEPSPYLEILREHKSDFTVLSGVSHPDVDGGHPADNCFLTAAPHPGSGGFKNTISLDQYAAEYIGHKTRVPSLTLGVNSAEGRRSLSWTGAGVLIPCEQRPSVVYRELFLQGSRKEIREQIRRLRQGQSIMDAVAEQARDLRGSLGARDRNRIDQYQTAVRELEQRLHAAEAWENRPKPQIEFSMPLDPEDPSEYMEKVALMYQMAKLAFETDSSRLVTLLLDSVNSPAIEIDGESIGAGYHNLSHHGKSEEKLAKLRAIDEAHMRQLGALYSDLAAIEEDGERLLDRTMVLYGSNLGDANRHVTTNLPILFAGGGFRHQGHLAFDRDRNYPLPNLFVSMLQRMGIETDRFASSTGTMSGLDFRS